MSESCMLERRTNYKTVRSDLLKIIPAIPDVGKLFVLQAWSNTSGKMTTLNFRMILGFGKKHLSAATKEVLLYLIIFLNKNDKTVSYLFHING